MKTTSHAIAGWMLAFTLACANPPAPARVPTEPVASEPARTDPAHSAVGPATARPAPAQAAAPRSPAESLREVYAKREVRIPMRDGVELFTSIYAPRDTSQRWPILLRRTPYSVRPYGADAYPETLGPSALFPAQKYIFVNQDVRGAYMSQGEFVDMRPQIDAKGGVKDVDESSDAWDTIDWLVKHVENNNGRVGLYGISYPGFYAAAGMIDAHPALKAVSPQAPIADWFFDDFHHHGALFLPHAFNFFSGFGQPRPEPTTERPPGIDHKMQDGYQFFLDMGPLSNANERYFKGKIRFWNDLAEHPDYDAFWKARDLQPHLKRVAPAVMTVGGWFDAEDLYGALHIYRATEEQNPGVFNVIVMGPWAHGGWSRSDGESLGNISFGAKTAERYRAELELPFFDYFLKDKGRLALPEASMFDTGSNRWRSFDHWPPEHLEAKSIFLLPHGRASFFPEHIAVRGAAAREAGGVFDEFESDPAKPVPFTEAIATGMTREYMTDDQRFAARRPDVLTWQTEVLANDVTLAGPLTADLTVSTTGTDADWVVKLIDVFPPDAPDNPHVRAGEHMSGYQMMVRSEVIRGRFRKSLEHPEPFVPDEKTPVSLELQDVLHTFQKGHRIEIQVQCTWFPLVDRNPQKYVDNIFQARESDFVKTTQRVWHGSHVQVGVLK
jgi:putative CocE/NonD family hydrolase